MVSNRIINVHSGKVNIIPSHLTYNGKCKEARYGANGRGEGVGSGRVEVRAVGGGMPLLGGRGAIIGTGIAPGIGRAGVIGRGRAAVGGC